MINWGLILMREPILIFDFGNVVGFFDYLRACERFAGDLAMSGPDFRDLLVERGFARLLAEFESGQIGADAFAARLMEMAGIHLTLRGLRPRLGRHLLAERIGMPSGRVPEDQRVCDLSRLQYQSPPRHPLPAPVRRRRSTCSTDSSCPTKSGT